MSLEENKPSFELFNGGGVGLWEKALSKKPEETMY